MQRLHVPAGRLLHRFEFPKGFTVIPKQPVLGRNPNKPGAILEHGREVHVGQTLVAAIVLETIALGLRGQADRTQHHENRYSQRRHTDRSNRGNRICFSANS